ncbi:TlpA family protein disulfide reductase [Luteimonas sp. SJ-92]|uniref:TlpA family protein disulfide reductase n=1 Tax=Luteimonas salinisoli TaxID=2752307 RepID=A0A853JFU4_9GAMM|nr:TlpA disulfide reductase family protein [Luteimonas salinisoli]NZA27338.1 TlpA family protein disulfide reductase [Luteimonas salinisoli]
MATPTQPADSPAAPRRSPLLPAALLLALALVALLAWQNRELRQQRDWLGERATRPYHGMYVPEIAVDGIDGQALVLGRAQGGFQVLYFFAPQCPYCLESVPMVRALAARLQQAFGGRVQMIGVGDAAAATLQAYVREHRLDFPVAAVQDRRTLMLYRGSSVPLVLVVGADGRVLHSQLGTLDTMDQVGSILAAMRTETPPAAATPTRSTP